LEKKLNDWTGVANIYNPEMDVEKLPRLLIQSIEIEGPVEKEWPPASHKSLLFAGDERTDEAYVREIFARLLPRAYRRPVTAGEIDAIVGRQGCETTSKSFHEAANGLRACLARQVFVSREPRRATHLVR
jgi:hypothetical protein